MVISEGKDTCRLDGWGGALELGNVGVPAMAPEEMDTGGLRPLSAEGGELERRRVEPVFDFVEAFEAGPILLGLALSRVVHAAA